VTLLVVGIVSLFLVCQLPDFCLRLVETVSQLVIGVTRSLGQQVNWSKLVKTVNQLVEVKPDWSAFTPLYLNTATNALLTVNASANCLVYCFSGRRFYRQL